MEDRGRTWGYGLAAVGALALLVALWLPWYSFQIPGWAIDRADALANNAGALGPLLHETATVARNLGVIHFTAWQALSQIDVALAGAASVAGVVSLLALSGRASGVQPVVLLAGLLGLVLSAYRVIAPPGPSELLHPAYGAYLALAAAVAVTVGGGLAGTETGHGTAAEYQLVLDPAVPAPGQPPGPRSMAGSVPPPGS
jgi:hypothetical protein